MNILFLVSSDGDTNLAIATINHLLTHSTNSHFHIVPMTQVAQTRVESITDNPSVVITPYQTIKDCFTDFILSHQFDHVYVGVPSNNHDEPLALAKSLTIPFTIVYEYMFHESSHVFWNHVEALSQSEHCQFAAALTLAADDIINHAKSAKVHVVGHLSLDRATHKKLDVEKIKQTREILTLNNEDDFVFASGSSQNIERDKQFLSALLSELSQQTHPHLKIRFGVHPGVSDADLYLSTMLEACNNYTLEPSQFKIVLNAPFANKLKGNYNSPYLHEEKIPDSDAAEAADKVAQAVPGALLNEASYLGIPSYFHTRDVKVYMPVDWFSNSVSAFFSAKRANPHTPEELHLQGTAPSLVANLLKNQS